MKTGEARWFNRLVPAMAAALLVLLFVDAIFSVAVLNQQKVVRHNQQVIAAGQAGGCARLQIVRDDLNSLNSRVYRIIAVSAGNPKPAELARLLEGVARETPATAALFMHLTANTAKARPIYQEILRDTVYLPPTDCHAAVHDPGFKPPLPVPFPTIASCYDPLLNPRPITCP